MNSCKTACREQVFRMRNHSQGTLRLPGTEGRTDTGNFLW